jgi:hypothetical protein
MATYVLECGEHTDAECEAMSKELEEYGTPNILKGRDFFCSCPFGHHAGWAIVEASSRDAVLSDLAPKFRAHVQVHEIETMQF